MPEETTNEERATTSGAVASGIAHKYMTGKISYLSLAEEIAKAVRAAEQRGYERAQRERLTHDSPLHVGQPEVKS